MNQISRCVKNLDCKIFNCNVIGCTPSHLRLAHSVEGGNFNVRNLWCLVVGIDDGLVDVERNATSIHVGATRAHQNRGALIGGWKILRASNADVDHVIGFAVGRDSDVIKRSARERKL